jgi:general secretion pathway protein H
VPLAWASGPGGYAFVQIGPQGWEPVDSGLLRPRAWPWLGRSDDIASRNWRSVLGGQPRAASYFAGPVTVSLIAGGLRGLGAPPSWLLFGTEPVGGAVQVELSDGAERDTIASDGFAPFVVGRSQS